ncbi:putative pyridoxal kinase [Marasmius crinis-equi]|uniref:pyridoxal kinase n=1 Tax=Marasmius crinis-equi TaxID=585013 RepID=A0ABR3FI48_9AGAR
MNGRILSVQSHVAYGYVGGKAAVFPLQCMGYDVDVVHTVHYSNHAGYARSGGTKTSASELKTIFESMEKNELLNPSRLLTGYIPNAEALLAVKDLATKLKEQNSNLVYLLDPVMGDSGRLYVAPDVVPVYRDMLPLSTIITPNWFEVETLTDIPLVSLDSLHQALTKLHVAHKVPHVVISSIPLKPWLAAVLPTDLRPAEGTDYLLCISSSHTEDQTSQLPFRSTVHAKTVPLLPGYFSGVGDLFSALLLGHYDPSSPSTGLPKAAAQALSKTHAILTRTLEYSRTLPQEEQLSTDDEKDLDTPLRKTRRMRGRELRLVQSLDILTEKTERDMTKLDEFWNAELN